MSGTLVQRNLHVTSRSVDTSSGQGRNSNEVDNGRGGGASPVTAAPASGLAATGALILLSISYVHMATASFALPAMLPTISSEMQLSDLQGALLTTGYR